MADLHKAEAAAREVARARDADAYSRSYLQQVVIDLLAALDAARGEAVAVLDAPPDGPDLEIRNPYRPSESWHIKATAIGLKVSREAIDHTARLLELSDHHLTNGPYPIDRGKTYWRAQAAVAIGEVNELASKTEQGKESGNG